MLATEIKKIRKGKCFQVLEDLYGVDIDKLVSKDISDKAFVGTLTGIYTKEELFQIVINLTNIVSGDYPDMIKKGEIIEILEIEYDQMDDSKIQYIEFKTALFSQRVIGWSGIRLECLKLIRR